MANKNILVLTIIFLTSLAILSIPAALGASLAYNIKQSPSPASASIVTVVNNTTNNIQQEKKELAQLSNLNIESSNIAQRPITAKASVDIGFIGPINLQCPKQPKFKTNLPQRPYNFKLGDCASLGKEQETEEYLEALNQVAQDCLNSVDENIQAWSEKKQDIIDYLQSIPSPSDSELLIAPVLPIFGLCSEPSESVDYEETPEGFAYTHLLETLEEAVTLTCERSKNVNRYLESLICLCEDVADYINGDESLASQTKEDLINTFSSRTINESLAHKGPQIAYDWFLYVNNSWHEYYNPEYISCEEPGLLIKPLLSNINKVSKDFTNKAIKGLEVKEAIQVSIIDKPKVPTDIANDATIPKKSTKDGAKEVFIVINKINKSKDYSNIDINKFVARSEEELKDYLGALIQNDKNIQKVEILNNSTKLDYSSPAKLFGFIPIKYNMNINVAQNRKVEIKLPWYASFAKKDIDVSKLKEELESNLPNQTTDENLEFLAIQTKVQNLQQTIQTLSNILKTKHDAALNAIRNIRS